MAAKTVLLMDLSWAEWMVDMTVSMLADPRVEMKESRMDNWLVLRRVDLKAVMKVRKWAELRED